MKTAAFTAALLLSLSSVAAMLLPASHSTCLNAENPSVVPECVMGSRFYLDGDGQCGCLPEPDVIPADVCARAYIICKAEDGLTYRTIYENRQMCGIYEKVQVGCGCFGTDEGIHIWTDPDVQ